MPYLTLLTNSPIVTFHVPYCIFCNLLAIGVRSIMNDPLHWNSNYLKESKLWIESHDRVVVQIFGQWKFVDLDRTLHQLK